MSRWNNVPPASRASAAPARCVSRLQFERDAGGFRADLRCRAGEFVFMADESQLEDVRFVQCERACPAFCPVRGLHRAPDCESSDFISCEMLETLAVCNASGSLAATLPEQNREMSVAY